MAILTGCNNIIRDSTVWDFKMWLVAILTGDPINSFFTKERYGRFITPKKTSRNNKVTLLTL